MVTTMKQTNLPFGFEEKPKEDNEGITIIEADKEVKKKEKRLKEGQFKVELDYGNFSTDGKDFKKGDRFISLNIDGHNCGHSSPCLNREEVIKSIKNYIENEKGRIVYFRNNTNEDILLADIM